MAYDAQGHASFEYGKYQVTGLVVVGVPQVTPLGTPDAGSFSPDGTITITISNSLVGGEHAGDVLGSIFARTFTVNGSTTARSTTAIDSLFATNSALVGTLYCSAPTVTTIAENDQRIAYSTGWHRLTTSPRSAAASE